MNASQNKKWARRKQDKALYLLLKAVIKDKNWYDLFYHHKSLLLASPLNILDLIIEQVEFGTNPILGIKYQCSCEGFGSPSLYLRINVSEKACRAVYFSSSLNVPLLSPFENNSFLQAILKIGNQEKLDDLAADWLELIIEKRYEVVRKLTSESNSHCEVAITH